VRRGFQRGREGRKEASLTSPHLTLLLFPQDTSIDAGHLDLSTSDGDDEDEDDGEAEDRDDDEDGGGGRPSAPATNNNVEKRRGPTQRKKALPTLKVKFAFKPSKRK